MAKDLQKTGSKEVAEHVDVSMFSGESTGFEGVTSATYKTPFLKILQGLSPELKASNPKYIPEAKQGLFCNSASQQLYSSVQVVVLKIEHSLITWKPDRGGFVGRVNKSEEESVVSTKEGLQKWDSMGNTIMDTIEFFCMNIEDPSDMFILSLSAASFKHARSFATRLRMLKTPDGKSVQVTWAGVWKISVVEESNDKGSWYTIGGTPELLRFITKEEKENLVSPARKMLETAETDYSVIAEEAESTEEETAY
jgi:hypothetical protein